MKRAVDTYGFINAKLRAKIGNIRSDLLEDKLLKAGSLVEAIGILREHGYTVAADTFDKTGDLQMVELSLLKDEIIDFKNVRKYLEGYPKDIISTMVCRTELENLKNGIRLWYSSAVHHRPITYRTSYLIKEKIVNKINYIALINAITYDNLISAVSGTWYETVLKQFTFDYIVKNGLFALESSLDKYWYKLFFENCEKLKGEDYKVANKLALMEVDLKNILMLVRYGWFHKMESKQLKETLYPYGHVYKNPDVLKYIKSNPQERNAESLLIHKYPQLAHMVKDSNKFDSKSLMIDQTRAVEKYLMNQKKQLFNNILGGKPFTIGTPLAYFYLREEQYYMICGILGGKYYGIDSEKIKGILS